MSHIRVKVGATFRDNVGDVIVIVRKSEDPIDQAMRYHYVDQYGIRYDIHGRRYLDDVPSLTEYTPKPTLQQRINRFFHGSSKQLPEHH